jgi:hypothetical protein
MLGPDPPDLVSRIVLVLGKPELPLFGDHIKDLRTVSTRNIKETETEHTYLASLIR